MKYIHIPEGITVDHLIELLKQQSEAGYGGRPVRCPNDVGHSGKIIRVWCITPEDAETEDYSAYGDGETFETVGVDLSPDSYLV